MTKVHSNPYQGPLKGPHPVGWTCTTSLGLKLPYDLNLVYLD